jgi:uncharacterized lipoprotein
LIPALRSLGLAVLCGAGLAGCFGTRNPDDRCADVAEYQGSSEAAPVVAPAGLQLPSQTSGYTVPPAPGPDPKWAACLSRPPAYFRPDPGATPPAAGAAGD